MTRLWMTFLLVVLPAAAGLSWVVLEPGRLAPETARLALGGGSAACFGWLLAGIHAFDERSELKLRASSAGRIVMGAASGVLLAALWCWPVPASLLSAAAGAALGRSGLTWARYAHF